MVQMALSNTVHPEYGVVTIPFPIPEEGYGHCLELLKALEIGSAVNRDCKVREVQGGPPILKRLGGNRVSLDKLDYLAKRLGSLTDQGLVQLQSVAVSYDYSSIAGLTNLTFSCREITVITSFSDLEGIGRNHYMTLNGRSARTEELDSLGEIETALLLVESKGGVITPHGVMYDNCTRLSQDYDGCHLPEYYYTRCTVSVMLSMDGRPEQREMPYLPCTEGKISHAVWRLGVDGPKQCITTPKLTKISDTVRGIFGHECSLNERLDTLSALTRYLQTFDRQTLGRFHTVFDTAWPQTPEEVPSLAENPHEFTVVSDINTTEEYGRYMIQESDHFEMDPGLEDYIDYQSYGEHRVREKDDLLGGRGYTAYLGTKSEVKEIMARSAPAE